MTQHVTRLERVLSAAAVVAGLVFVGLQTRQNTIALRDQTRQALADASRDALLTVASNPDLARTLVALLQAPPDPTRDYRADAESVQVSNYFFALMRNAENVFLQSREGVLGEDIMGTYGFVGPLFSRPQFHAWWAGNRQWFNSDFVPAFETANQIPGP